MNSKQTPSKNQNIFGEHEIKAIEAAFENRELLNDGQHQELVLRAVQELNAGTLRIAEPMGDHQWKLNVWLKKAVLLFFGTQKLQVIQAGDLEFWDKMPLRKDFEKMGVRCVPSALVRYGAFIEKGTILMPSYVNIGAYVGSNCMVDTWATVGSCAQIGNDVHLSGGVGIGGVLEPAQAQPVIIEDRVFVGSRAVLVEGVHIEEGAVIAANVCLTASTPIIDVTQNKEKVYKGKVPAYSVVIPGIRQKTYPAGTFGIPCALIIGQRQASTDQKTSLNKVLREFELAV